MYVYIVASLQSIWFILERHTKNRNQNIYPAAISRVVVYLGEMHENRDSDRSGIYFTTIEQAWIRGVYCRWMRAGQSAWQETE